MLKIKSQSANRVLFWSLGFVFCLLMVLFANRGAFKPVLNVGRLVRLDPRLSSLSANPIRTVGGNTITGTVVLEAPAPAGGVTIDLFSDETNAATVPATVIVPEGETQATFDITTSVVSQPAFASIYAMDATYGVSIQRPVFVVPNGHSGILMAVTFSPTTVSLGATATGTVFLSEPAPSGGITVALVSTDETLATVPADVAVEGGAYSATFSARSYPPAQNTYVAVAASYQSHTCYGFLYLDALYPDTPTNLTAVAGDGVVHLQWDAVPGATKYQIWSGEGGPTNHYDNIQEFPVLLDLPATSTVEFDDFEVTNGVTRYYVVVAENPAGGSAESDEASATPQLGLPPAPQYLHAAGGDAKVVLAWEESQKATAYKVGRSLNANGPFSIVATVEDTRYVDSTNVANGTAYHYVVSAVNSVGESATSNVASAEASPPQLTEAQALQRASTFCTAIGSPASVSGTAEFPAPKRILSQQDSYPARRWLVRFGEGVEVEVVDSTSTIPYYHNLNILRQLVANNTPEGTAIAESVALSKMDSVLQASGLTESFLPGQARLTSTQYGTPVMDFSAMAIDFA
jgi:fibronectin type 3 domain-containing protein